MAFSVGGGMFSTSWLASCTLVLHGHSKEKKRAITNYSSFHCFLELLVHYSPEKLSHLILVCPMILVWPSTRTFYCQMWLFHSRPHNSVCLILSIYFRKTYLVILFCRKQLLKYLVLNRLLLFRAKKLINSCVANCCDTNISFCRDP